LSLNTNLQSCTYNLNSPTIRELKKTYKKVKRTKRGKKLCKALEKSKEVYIIQGADNDAYFNPDDNSINVDPNFHPSVQTTEGSEPAPTDSILGHEIGHAATGTLDDGLGNMNNVNQNENPIRRELGEPDRTEY